MSNQTTETASLTPQQQEIYGFLKDVILNRGYGPTIREIGSQFGIRSPNGVMLHLKALEKKGLITRESHMSRAIQLVDEQLPSRAITAELDLVAAWNAGQLQLNPQADPAACERIRRAIAAIQVTHVESDADRSTEWTEKKNARRCELIVKELAESISKTELVELHRLQSEALLHRKQVAPLPMDGVSRLLKQLVERNER